MWWLALMGCGEPVLPWGSVCMLPEEGDYRTIDGSFDAVVIAPPELPEFSCSPENDAVHVEDLGTGERWTLGWLWHSDLQSLPLEFEVGEAVQVTGQVVDHFDGPTTAFAISDAAGLRYAASDNYPSSQPGSALYPSLSWSKGERVRGAGLGSCYRYYGLELETQEGPLTFLPGEDRAITLEGEVLRVQIGVVSAQESAFACHDRISSASWVAVRETP